MFHIPLDDKPRIEIGVVPGNRTDHGTLAAVKAEMYPGILYFLSMMRHGFLLSRLLYLGDEILDLFDEAFAVASRQPGQP